MFYELNEELTTAKIYDGDMNYLGICPVRLMEGKYRIYLKNANLPSGKLWLTISPDTLTGKFEDKVSVLRHTTKGTRSVKVTLDILPKYLTEEENAILQGFINKATETLQQEKTAKVIDNELERLYAKIALLEAKKLA